MKILAETVVPDDLLHASQQDFVRKKKKKKEDIPDDTLRSSEVKQLVCSRN